MGGDTGTQAQQFLERIFGVGHTYSVFDGDYGEWMNIVVDDDDVHELHIEIQSIEPLILKIIRVEFSLPDDLEDVEVDEGFEDQILAEANDLVVGTEWSLVHMEFGGVMIDILNNYDGLNEDTIPDLATIKNVVRKIKEKIGSYKEK
jgi:hypothetical protein